MRFRGMRTLVTLALLVGACALPGSGGAAGGSAAQTLAHLQAFDESLENLQVDLTAPLVLSTPAETHQRLDGLGSLIDEAFPNIKQGFPGASSAVMLPQVKSIESALAAAAKDQGAAQLHDLARAAVAEAPLEAEVAVAAAAPGSSDPLAMVRGASDFGVEPLASQTASTSTFENALTTPVTISSVQIGAGAFSITGDECSGRTLAPLGMCEVTVSFAPTSTGTSTGTLAVKDSATSMPEQDYPLTGVGAASGSAQVVVKTGASATPLTPGTPVMFPEQTALSSFATAGERLQAIQLINVGTTSATFDDVTIEGPNAHDFILTPGRGTQGCEDATLAPGSLEGATVENECYVSVEVKAARYTQPLKASLVVTGSHTGNLAPIPLALTQADLSLGSLLATKAAGQVTYKVSVRNAGPDPAERTEIDARVTANTGSLRLVSSVPEGCAYGSSTGILTCTVGTLPAHALTSVTVVFQTPKTAVKLTNLATVQSLDFDPTSGNDVRTLVTALK